MPRFQDFTFPSCSHLADIHVRACLPDTPVRATVQIAHGIAEYINRYDPFMEFLARHGFAVYGDDHLGHGQSVREERYGYVGDTNGWRTMLSDLRTLHDHITAAYPEVPHFLFGHSMGSFLARCLLIRSGDLFDGCILCGTGHPPKAMTMGARALAAIEIRRHGAGYLSPLLNSVMNTQYNNGYENPRTFCDWISSDPNRVDEYIADPLCGFVPSAGLMSEMLKGVSYMTAPRNLDRMPKDVPVYFISGADDPVGELGQGVIRAYKAFMKCGMEDVSLRLYPGQRHELLLDTKGEDAMVDVLNWIEQHT